MENPAVAFSPPAGLVPIPPLAEDRPLIERFAGCEHPRYAALAFLCLDDEDGGHPGIFLRRRAMGLGFGLTDRSFARGLISLESGGFVKLQRVVVPGRRRVVGRTVIWRLWKIGGGS